jgi:hypothetical protein
MDRERDPREVPENRTETPETWVEPRLTRHGELEGVTGRGFNENQSQPHGDD